MAVRSGRQYLQDLSSKSKQVYLNGQCVEDVTKQLGIANGAKAIASLYDMQIDPNLIEQMTFKSPTTGDQVGLSFIQPKSASDLTQRRFMMMQWARFSFGMMGRTPDFLNVSVMAMAAASDYFSENRPEFGNNVRNYFEFVREKDLVLTHTLVNLQRSRDPQDRLLQDGAQVALAVSEENKDGIVLNGSRILATLGPISDELIVYPAGTHHLPTDNPERYAFAFAIPTDTLGLKFLCRETLDLGRTNFDHPFASRFEEMDAIVFFDNVLVPWDRVFLLGDIDRCNEMSRQTGQYIHSGHQVVTRNVAKSEFVLGLATLMTDTLGNKNLPHIQLMLAELTEDLELMKACLRSAEADAGLDKWGVMCPAEIPIRVARNLFMRLYPRMIEILHMLGSSSLMALPSEADLTGPISEEIRYYLSTDVASADERVKLFRLAWDTACSAYAGRQVVYERFFQGDSQRNAVLLNNVYDTSLATDRIKQFLGLGDNLGNDQ
ncbi:4-hydroxyphenylacetate 3-monooxygenase, oxygenase component [SAR202 cluster bacterium AD-804-J14_MRT_500m]|nr:4-hydroxyphenylacetate 3-monooxygenase, oxygenase component [SAR202 cluster bacterium AD-804-J14_MRT_500m]